MHIVAPQGISWWRTATLDQLIFIDVCDTCNGRTNITSSFYSGKLPCL